MPGASGGRSGATPDADGCTPDHKAKGYCNAGTYASNLPSEYQYFSNPKMGGSLEQADYCPL